VDCVGRSKREKREVAALTMYGQGARFENTDALETIGSDLTSSFRIQLVTEESEEGREPIETDREG
jgi:hypothetical protein